eukprot:TRINITY_DN108715_c0_g1_i1.p1 TRINITY_DN108715_c0_g1~~TRINITY_DN108715_c0_g1_i1.p1  ORF type:complete len:424 (-),score=72.61 TRINITY_DN108715_c0_g1_i1:185-1420(-)
MAKATAEAFVAEQLDSSIRFFDMLRSPQGMYYDKLTFDGTGSPFSTAATGFGLVSLAISVERGLVTRGVALGKAQSTLESVKGCEQFFIARSKNGFMAHFPGPDGASEGEISTIDTAILILGALFVDNFFQDEKLRNLVEEVAGSVSWGDAFIESLLNGPQMYMTFKVNGVGEGLTRPFNEYYLLALCGAIVESQILKRPGKAHSFFVKYFNKPPSASYNRSNYWGFEVLTDINGRFLPSFIVQYCFYFSKHFASSEDYRAFVHAACAADISFWEKATPDMKHRPWGSGAGAYPEHFAKDPSNPCGYKAVAIDDNEHLVYSAPIVAGFLPFRPEIAEQLESWHKESNCCKYKLPNGDDVLWRASVRQPAWRAASVEAVDFAPMLLGSAAHVLGLDFFEKYAPDVGILDVQI